MTVPFNRDPVFALYGTEDLLRAEECLRYDQVECENSDEPEATRLNGIAFIRLQLDSIQRELTRRERLRSLPGAPGWPAEPTPEFRAFLREVKDRVSVLDFYHRSFPMQPLRRSGTSWRGRCVLHGGENPSAFSVFNDGRNWRCHSCGAGGDVYDLAALIYRTTNFRELVERLAEEFGIEKLTKPSTWEPELTELPLLASRRRGAGKPRYPDIISGRVVVR